MRLLLDESVPIRLRRFLHGHSVKTVAEMGWQGTKNGLLLQLAAKQFDALLTVDKNLPQQQNPRTLPLAVVVLDTYSSELSALMPLLPELSKALAKLQPNSLSWVRL